MRHFSNVVAVHAAEAALLLALATCSGAPPSSDSVEARSDSGSSATAASAAASSATVPNGSSADGGGGGLIPDAADGGSIGDGDAPAPLPQVDYNDGGILTAPEIVTVTYAANLYTNANATAATLLTDLQAFNDGIMSTSWWSTVTADYCGTAGCIGQAAAHISISTEPPGDGTSTCGVQPCYTDSAIGATSSLKLYLSGLLANGTLPAPTAQTLYVVYMPRSVTINVDGEVTCVHIGGYHDSLTVGTLDVAYAIVPICNPEMTGSPAVPELTLEETATMAASHEIVEAVLDPHGGEVPAGGNPYSTQYLGWYLTDPARQAWAAVGGGEVADLCVDVFGLGQDRWTEGNHLYQRIWSNSSAAANGDPCVPIPPGDTYFNAGPTTVQNEQLQLAVGASVTYPVVAFADGRMSTWDVFGFDQNNNEVLSFEPTSNVPAPVQSGSMVALSITLDQAPPTQPNQPASTPPFEPYMIVSVFPADAGTPTAAHFWPGIIAESQ